MDAGSSFRVVVDGASVDIAVRQISRLAWARLRDAHPSAKGGLWDEDTFPPALIAACTGFTLEQAREAWDHWPATDAEALFAACIRASAPASWQWATERFRVDGRLALEVRVASRMGIAHSVFASWSSRDQDLALASAEAEASRCPGCGAPAAAMRDPRKADVIVESCLMCQAKAAAVDSIPPEQRGHTHVMVVPASGA